MFFESMRSAEKGDDWGAVGGHARMTNAFLGRQITTDLELTVWDPPREFRSPGDPVGRPSAGQLEGVRAGTRGNPVEGHDGDRGWSRAYRLVDRVKMRAIQRMYAKAMQRLPEVVGKTQGTTSG